MNNIPSPQILDSQSSIHIDEWIEIGSPPYKEKVQNSYSLNYFMKAGFQEPNPFMFVDIKGRVWVKGDSKWYPFHDTVNGKNYGWKLSKMAAN